MKNALIGKIHASLFIIQCIKKIHMTMMSHGMRKILSNQANIEFVCACKKWTGLPCSIVALITDRFE